MRDCCDGGKQSHILQEHSFRVSDRPQSHIASNSQQYPCQKRGLGPFRCSLPLRPSAAACFPSPTRSCWRWLVRGSGISPSLAQQWPGASECLRTLHTQSTCGLMRSWVSADRAQSAKGYALVKRDMVVWTGALVDGCGPRANLNLKLAPPLDLTPCALKLKLAFSPSLTLCAKS